MAMESSDNRGIPLAEMIQQLRRELQESVLTSAEENLRFKVESIELELQVTVSREAEGSAGIKFWVVDLGGKYKQAGQDVHTFKLKLLPLLGPQRSEVLVAGEQNQKPV